MTNKDGPRCRRAVRWCAVTACLVLLTTPAGAQTSGQDVAISGRTSTTGGDVLLPGVVVTVTDPVSGDIVATTVSDGQGRFVFSAIASGTYVVTASLSGFNDASQSPVLVVEGQSVVVDFDLSVAGFDEMIDVEAVTGPTIEILETPMLVETLEGELLDIVPVQGENFDALLPLLPGVVRTPRGRLSVKGGLGTQTSLRVNSVNVSDPVTGEFGTTLPDDAVGTLTLLPNPYAAEYGGFSAGVAEVETQPGTDEWHWSFTNFVPVPRFRDSTLQGIGKFRPRFALSGPLRVGRVRLSQNVQYRLVKTKVEIRPETASDNFVESFDSFTQINADLNDRHHLLATASVFPRDLARIGVDTFTPPETSSNLLQRGYNYAVSERAILGRNGFLESNLAYKRLGIEIGGVGDLPMLLAPEENGGNFFNSQDRDTWTLHWTEVLTLQRQSWFGDHVFKVGLDVRQSDFDGESLSRPVLVRRADGSLSQRIEYGDPTVQDVESTDLGMFVQDRWRLSDRLLFELGTRVERNEVLKGLNLSPRFGFVWSLAPNGTRVVRSGVGIFHPNTTLNVKAFEFYETPTVTRFDDDGTVRSVTRFTHDLAAEVAPSSLIWNVEYFHAISNRFLTKLNFLRRTSDNEMLLHPLEDGFGEGVLRVDSDGRSRYWEFEATSRLLVGPHDMNFSFVHSASQGDLNVFDDFFGNFRDPIIRPNQFSRNFADTRNRFLFRGSFLIKGWMVSPVLEVRQGFPYSSVDEDLNFVGVRNRAGRFPNVSVLDVDVQRPISIAGFDARVGFRVFHLFDANLPRDVQHNIASPRFGQFSNYVDRSIGLTFEVGL